MTAAANWKFLVPFIAAERRLGERMAARPGSAAVYEFVRFGIKQGWACLFGGIMVALMIGTSVFYPKTLPVSRYDFMFLAALMVQALLLRFRMETVDEAKVIVIYHLVGTAMEVFKTGAGSWVYPEPSVFRILGVPLFTGFMYSCVGSYLCRAWRLFDFEFTRHPPIWSLVVLSVAIYANFFSHHYTIDIRLVLFAAAAGLFGPTTIYFTVWRRPRRMPLLVGLLLVSVFIWISENVGTYTKTWLYPGQINGWSMVTTSKLGSWFLLLVISYTLVALVNKPTLCRAAPVEGSRFPGWPMQVATLRAAVHLGCAVLMVVVGFLCRWPGAGLPPVLAKYGGAVVWGALVYWVMAFMLRRPAGMLVAVAAAAVAAAVELSQLAHVGWLDAFRRTSIGVLLIGRYFSWADIAAYWAGIAVAAGVDWRFICRGSNGQGDRPGGDQGKS